MSRSAYLVLIHLLSCLAFLALPYVFAQDGFAKLAELPVNPHEQRNLASYLLTIAFFYTNFYWLIPRLFFSKKYVLYGLCVLICFLFVQGTLTVINQRANPTFNGVPPQHVPDHGPPPYAQNGQPGLPPSMPPGGSFRGGPPQSSLPAEISQTFFLFLVGLLLSLAIRINSRWRETEQQRLSTELSYLKAQINPHFLFNTLNSIYSLAIEQSAATADAIVQLSSFLRYVIAEGRQDSVALSHELGYVGHYIALQRLRLDDTVPVQYDTKGTSHGLQITPLVLISFIENAFKYGASPQEPSQIRVEINVTGKDLHLLVFNQKVRVSDATAASSGIGLTNTKARLQLLYPGRHKLEIQDEPASFTVNLYLTLA
ncbi:sensor histidine kinase [Fibrella forsythiae]|uniref:Histidine kinase n=1 Tax=Fibrella forsythiae TaxID=2817061 RepID=A0ABS3JPQ5_9BACT|nr:histidine kinase [Fibrella forsythiae]MBO0951985.1 histidine kinase [Fibrella forsythiae]